MSRCRCPVPRWRSTSLWDETGTGTDSSTRRRYRRQPGWHPWPPTPPAKTLAAPERSRGNRERSARSALRCAAAYRSRSHSEHGNTPRQYACLPARVWGRRGWAAPAAQMAVQRWRPWRIASSDTTNSSSVPPIWTVAERRHSVRLPRHGTGQRVVNLEHARPVAIALQFAGVASGQLATGNL